MLFLIHIFASSYTTNLNGIFFQYRNGIYFGVPMFSMGIFFREYSNQIMRNFKVTYKKEVIMFLLGGILSIIQRLGLGLVELPIGAFLQAVAMMLWAVQDPVGAKINSKWGVKISIWSGKISMMIYIIHPLIRDVIETYSSQIFVLKNEAKFPLIVLGISFFIGNVIQGTLTLKNKLLQNAEI